MWTAILVCLEHSFWIVQQGSHPIDGFTKAWKFYIETQYALVDQKLDEYLKSRGHNDWITMQYVPSKEERVEYTKIVLDSLLRMSSSCLFWALIVDVTSAHPQTS